MAQFRWNGQEAKPNAREEHGKEDVMNMIKKIVILLAALWPLSYVLFFMGSMLMAVAIGQGMVERLWDNFLVVHADANLSIVALMVGFLVHVLKNPRLEREQRVLWVMVVLFGNILTLPVYWYFQIWKEGEGDPIARPRRNTLSGLSG